VIYFDHFRQKPLQIVQSVEVSTELTATAILYERFSTMSNEYYDFALQERDKWNTELHNVLKKFNYTLTPLDGLGVPYINTGCSTIQTGALGALMEDWIGPHFINYVKSNLSAQQSPYDFCHIDKPVYINLKTKGYIGNHSGIAAGTLIQNLYKGAYIGNPHTFSKNKAHTINTEPKLFMVSVIPYFINDEEKCIEVTMNIETYFVESIIYGQVKKHGLIYADNRTWGSGNPLSGRLQIPNFDVMTKKCFPPSYKALHNIVMKLGKYL
jgi:hypothetical protein